MVYVWSFLMFIFLVGGHIFSKFSSREVGEGGKVGYPIFLIVTGVTACLFFWTTGGFHLQLNLLTAVYSMIYGLVVLVVNVTLLKAYQLAKVSDANLINSVGSLVVTSVMGGLLFREEVTFSVVLRNGIMLAAMFLVFFDMKKTEDHSEKLTVSTDENKVDVLKEHGPNDISPKKGRLLLFIIVNILLIGGKAASIIVLKYYANAGERVADDTSFFFFTNVFMVIGALIWFWIEQARKPAEKRSQPRVSDSLKIGVILIFVGATVSGNLSSLTELQLVELVDVSVFTPVVTALGLVSGGIASILFREKLGVCSALAMAFSVLAVIM